MLFSPKAIAEMVGLSATTIWRLRRAGQFPAPIQISSRRVGFVESEIIAWLGDRDRACGAVPPNAVH